MIDRLIRIACDAATDALAVIAVSLVVGGIIVGALVASLF